MKKRLPILISFIPLIFFSNIKDLSSVVLFIFTFSIADYTKNNLIKDKSICYFYLLVSILLIFKIIIFQNISIETTAILIASIISILLSFKFIKR